ncbi:MAG: GDP-mannose 4,6-dehydratase [Hymenobacter sp.]
MKVALITGITGQDGAYLAELLLSKGYEVHGLKRRSSLFNTDRIDHLYQDPHESNVRLTLHYGDLNDSTNLIRIVQEIQPDEIYNLGAMSHVKVSFDTPEYTANADGIGTLRLLEAIRILGLEKKTRIYQASTSELYGLVQASATKRDYSLLPPLALCSSQNVCLLDYSKLPGGIRHVCLQRYSLQPRESATRRNFRDPQDYSGVARISLGLQGKIFLGNIDSKRDWGHAQDYVEAMWRILQQDEPEDFVIATGVTTTVRDFVKMSFAEVGIEVEFSGEGVDEKGQVSRVSNPESKVQVGDVVVEIDPRYFRPTEVELLIGDPTKAKTKLGWVPKHDLASLVKDMMTADVELFRRDAYLLKGGHKVYNYHE